MTILLNNIQYFFNFIYFTFYFNNKEKNIKIEIPLDSIEDINLFIKNLYLNSNLILILNKELKLNYILTEYYVNNKLILMLKENKNE